jgi:hypothetical protein
VAEQREVGPGRVLLVAAACVAVVAVAVVLTVILPDDVEQVVYRPPGALMSSGWGLYRTEATA